MLTKTVIALSAVLTIGAASAAWAQAQGPNGYYVDGTLIGQTVNGTEAFASANAPVWHAAKPFTGAEKAQFDRATSDLSIR